MITAKDEMYLCKGTAAISWDLPAGHPYRLSRAFHLRCYEKMACRFPDWSWLSFDQPRAVAGEPHTPSTCDQPRESLLPALVWLPQLPPASRTQGEERGLVFNQAQLPDAVCHVPTGASAGGRGLSCAAQGSSAGSAQRLLPSQPACIHRAMLRAQQQQQHTEQCPGR